MGRFSIGQPVTRKEDQRFITGSGRYTDDISLDDQAFLYLFRSPYAHGAITKLDVADARQARGVLAVYTADDLTTAGIKDLIGADLPASPQNEAMSALRQPPLARERIRYVGEPVSGIVAESLAAARDAAELIWLDVDEESAAVTTADALQGILIGHLCKRTPPNLSSGRVHVSTFEARSLLGCATRCPHLT